MNLAMPVLLFALHSLVAEALNVTGSSRACRMTISRNARPCPSPRISPSSPKQLGMVSPELSCRVTRQPRLEDSQSPAVVRG